MLKKTLKIVSAQLLFVLLRVVGLFCNMDCGRVFNSLMISVKIILRVILQKKLFYLLY